MLVGIPVYHGVDVLDVTGPFEMLEWAGFEIVLAAEQVGPIRCRGGMSIVAPTSFAEAHAFDVLWTPGGEPEVLAEMMSDPRRIYLDFLIRQAAKATWVCSVCEGALLLAAAGLLDGFQVTTHWRFIPCLDRFPKVKVAPGTPRFWQDGNRLTGGGISAGLDEALELIRLVKGEEAARDVQQTTQYYPDPPVTSTLPQATDCLVPQVTIPPPSP